MKNNFLLILSSVNLSLLIGLFVILTPTQANEDYQLQNFKLEDMINSDAALVASLKAYGPKQTILSLSSLEGQKGFDCHQRAHTTGRLAAKIFPIEKAFREGSGECHSGYFHGTTEQYFAIYGTKNLSENLSKLCNNSLNSFFRHQCYHGVGHGLMGWTSYEINDALANCDGLTEGRDQNSCATGVFMENFTGAFQNGSNNTDHTSKYLSDNPQFPCNVVTSHKSECYFLQTSRMIQIFGPDFQKVSAECSKAPEQFQESCFQSMGRDVGGTTRPNPKASIEKCNFAPEGEDRNSCLNGAIQDYFWDPTGAKDAIEFCKSLSVENQKHLCYLIINGTATQILTTNTQKSDFCNSVEADFKDECQKQLSI